jgi:hypothetical protein
VLVVTPPAVLALFLAADGVLRANLSHNDLFSRWRLPLLRLLLRAPEP